VQRSLPLMQQQLLLALKPYSKLGTLTLAVLPI